ncbi:MAG: glycosyltransferase family 1 protein [Novosphingobium pentaromativorans]|uniref:Glycosyltransferase family 1 protein n=1 Tax=Novosphingobium pentaromativorans TaxID=205844 RepID=A0A2W5Q5J3_9SPHN|nr:glycosyltransferase family 1 protein [Novosphingobium panipatense]PZQ49973.1 MAG: glycosyltransferase family 1 protein [Novosphingobium pentaromativorans]
MAFLQPFLDLLPSRLEQAFGHRTTRSLRVRWRRWYTRVSRPAASLQRPRLFIDLAVISKHDAGTGIQRVVRAIALAVIDVKAMEWDIHFVAATRRRRYHLISWPDPEPVPRFEILRARPGDVFLGLDYSLDAVRRHRRQLAAFRRDGGQLWFLVHDLLPLEKPEWFSRNTVIRYRAWLGILADMADGFLCNSQQTDLDLRRNLEQEFGLRHGYVSRVLPMGHDIAESAIRQHEATQPLRIGKGPAFFLMVGTLEPRKGHADILAAFDRLWRAGSPERLVLVGRMGWQVDDLRQTILEHPERGQRLFWFDDVDDSELYKLYEKCNGSIIASFGEGFGLPVIESLGHGKPVLARDLPVFRPHAGAGVQYFPVDADNETLEDCLRRWIANVAAGQIIVQRPDTCWRNSALVLLDALNDSRPSQTK